MPRLLLYAPNIHRGGGKHLLDCLLNVQVGIETLIWVDDRYDRSELEKSGRRIYCVKPTIAGRLTAEFQLRRARKDGDIVLCFGNLPPLLNSKGETFVYMQNRSLFDGLSGDRNTLRSHLKCKIEQFWLKKFSRNAKKYLVQTQSMRDLAVSCLPAGTQVIVAPFERGGIGFEPVKLRNGENYSFIYVASGEPHKNHEKLIEAWGLLAKEGIDAKLLLTIDEVQFPKLCDWLKKFKNERRLNIENRGNLNLNELESLYKSSDALIYPSLMESFGLPLIEAKKFNLPVIGSELDYMRDVSMPIETFDPRSSRSIARAIKRYMGLKSDDIRVVSASNFLERLLRDFD